MVTTYFTVSFARLADKYGVEPPELVKLEKTTKIGWQDLIKLSMKSEGTKKVQFKISFLIRLLSFLFPV